MSTSDDKLQTRDVSRGGLKTRWHTEYGTPSGTIGLASVWVFGRLVRETVCELDNGCATEVRSHPNFLDVGWQSDRPRLFLAETDTQRPGVKAYLLGSRSAATVVGHEKVTGVAGIAAH